MKFIDLEAQQKLIKQNIDNRIQSVLHHGKYIMGPEVEQIESKLAEFIGVEHAISCSSGTDAILLALMANEVGPGDAIITSPFTFIATAEVICLLGATPVFVDIDPKTFNINPDKILKAINAFNDNDSNRYPLPKDHKNTRLKIRGIIAVDLFGIPADFERINKIAQDHRLFVIEDAAQSFGAESNGQKACSLADIGCTSFFPAKPLGAYGDGGMCFTDNHDLAEIMKSLRVHGKNSHKYDNIRIGINGRLDTIQAAILLAKFEIFPNEIKLRQQVASSYNNLLSESSSVELPEVPKNVTSAWAQYSILSKGNNNRSVLRNKLKESNIPTAVYYPTPLHLQPAFSCLGYKQSDFPVSEDISKRILSLPMYPYLIPEDQNMIAEIILKEL